MPQNKPRAGLVVYNEAVFDAAQSAVASADAALKNLRRQEHDLANRGLAGGAGAPKQPEPGSAPLVTARLEDGDRAEDIRPVTINGRLPMYEFRFARPYPGKHGGECASRFLVVLGLDQPIE